MAEKPLDKAGPDLLPESHRDCLEKAIARVLNTEIALETFGQVLDGLPTATISHDKYPSSVPPPHPVNKHLDICSGAIEQAITFRDSFKLDQLQFKSNVLEAYQSSLPSSRAFKLRLTELVADSLHQIAIYLYQYETKFHDAATTEGLSVEDVTRWESPPGRWVRVPPGPTLFSHPRFTAVDLYPYGVGDMVGYWAEDRILGGVPLFDRTGLWLAAEEPNIWYSPARFDLTFRVCQLLDDQQDRLHEFLMSDEDSKDSCPLPILVSKANRTRIDPYDRITEHQVYRDEWEQYPPEPSRGFRRSQDRCVIDATDYPEVDDETEEIRLLLEQAENADREARKDGNETLSHEEVEEQIRREEVSELTRREEEIMRQEEALKRRKEQENNYHDEQEP